MGYRRSIKVVMASAMVVSTAVMLHLVGPQIVRFLAAELPRVYALVESWLTPPYLYFVVNGIIISIAASSLFQPKSGSDSPQPESEPEPPPPEKEEEEKLVISTSTWSLEEQKTEVETEVVKEITSLTARPPISVRFPKRNRAKPNPDGGKLRIARSRKNETLEGTWKAITEGRAVPLARHLKKSDTWETRGGSGAREDDSSPAPAAAMRKTETFQTERGVARQGSGGRLRREASLGSEDLNRRVEAFINKFNEEMRLQRQESLKHYMEMINNRSSD